MTTLVALVSGFGWHVADLQRAAGALDIQLEAVPFPRSRPGRRGAAKGRGRRRRADRGRRRAGADDAAGEPGAGRFPDGCPAPRGGRGSSRLNPPRAVEAAVDKYLTLALLDQAGLPVPPTWTGQTASEALAAFEDLGGDVVVKPLFGSEGRGLVRVSDRELAWRTLPRARAAGRGALPPADDPPSRPRPSGLRASGARSGSDAPVCSRGRVAHQRLAGRPAEPAEIDFEAERLALAAAAAVGAEVAGVDLVADLDRGRLSSWRSTPSPAGVRSRGSPASTSRRRCSRDCGMPNR